MRPFVLFGIFAALGLGCFTQDPPRQTACEVHGICPGAKDAGEAGIDPTSDGSTPGQDGGAGGGSWQPMTNAPAGTWHSVWGTSAVNVWVVGSNARTLHWDGNAWTNITVPAPVQSGYEVRSVGGSGASDVRAVGGQGTTDPHFFHWDGSAWQPDPGPASTYLTPYAVTAGFGQAWVASDTDTSGVVLGWDGANWTQSIAQNSGLKRAAWVADTKHLWLIGDEIDLYDGTADANPQNGMLHPEYKESSPPKPVTLWGVHGTSAADVWVVGDGGRLLHRNPNGTWNGNVSGVTTDLRAVFARTAQDVWVAGAKGTMLHWNGKGWAPTQLPGQPGDFEGLWFASNGEGFAVGTGGVYHYTP